MWPRKSKILQPLGDPIKRQKLEIEETINLTRLNDNQLSSRLSKLLFKIKEMNAHKHINTYTDRERERDRENTRR